MVTIELSGGINWPRITIITPSFNQAPFLEETIRSVLFQNYPNLEFIIMDGGSTDGSVEIIKKYASWLAYWVSEPDRGQAHAINKGFAHCTGDLIGWINSDDLLLANSLEKVALAYKEHPGKILLGDVVHFWDQGSPPILVKQGNITFKNLALQPITKCIWQQPGTFVPGDLVRTNKIFLDESLRYMFDLDWMCRLLRIADVYNLRIPIAKFRLHQNSKTIGEKSLWLPEIDRVFNRYLKESIDENESKVFAYYELFLASVNYGGYDWNPLQGMYHLQQAVKLYPLVIFSFSFIKVILKRSIPLSFIRRCQSSLSHFINHFDE